MNFKLYVLVKMYQGLVDGIEFSIKREKILEKYKEHTGYSPDKFEEICRNGGEEAEGTVIYGIPIVTVDGYIYGLAKKIQEDLEKVELTRWDLETTEGEFLGDVKSLERARRNVEKIIKSINKDAGTEPGLVELIT